MAIAAKVAQLPTQMVESPVMNTATCAFTLNPHKAKSKIMMNSFVVFMVSKFLIVVNIFLIL